MAVMLIGIGFVVILTGAVAQRFLAHDVKKVAEAADDVRATDAELLAELREVLSRLDRLEARMSTRHA